MFFDSTFLLIIPVLILAFWAQSKVKGSYLRYIKEKTSSNLSGAEVARKIMKRNGIHDVKIKPIKGQLRDHYHPQKKELNLSEDVYYGKSIASNSIAAHEMGHALQHNENYAPLGLRTSIFPIARFGSTLAFPMFIIGLLFRTPIFMDIGIILFAGALLFHVFTLPVEFNASHRAIKQLSNGIIVKEDELEKAKKMLNAAALTYIASTLMALVQFLRLIILRGSRE